MIAAILEFHKEFVYTALDFVKFQKSSVMVGCRNCEDIAMSFLVANETGAPPIWVKGMSLLPSLLSV